MAFDDTNDNNGGEGCGGPDMEFVEKLHEAMMLNCVETGMCVPCNMTAVARHTMVMHCLMMVKVAIEDGDDEVDLDSWLKHQFSDIKAILRAALIKAGYITTSRAN